MGTVYLLHGDINTLEEQISDNIVRYSNVIIMGDFNNNLFDLGKSAVVRDVCSRFNLSVVHNSKPTHYDVAHESTSLLDYFLVSCPGDLRFSNQFLCPGISHHAFIFVSFDVEVPFVEEYYEYNDYESVSPSAIEEILNDCNFEDIYNAGNVDEQLSVLNNNLQIIHSIVPIKRRLCRTHVEDWFNCSEIKYYISLRNLAFQAYLFDKSSVNWKSYCRYRNRAKRVIRKIKHRSHAKVFDGKSTREIWTVLNGNGISNGNEGFIDIDVEQLSRVFLSNQSPVNHRFPNIPDDAYNGFSFRAVEYSEVVDAFKMIKATAVGCDGLKLKFLKLVFPFVGTYVWHIVNRIITTSVFPSDWKIAKVIPIPKKGNINSIENMRPISIMPILSKMVENVMKIQIVDHLEAHSLLHDCQSGFRSNRSTTSLLIGLTDNVRSHVGHGGCCVLLSLDLEKAFDKIDHTILVEKLHFLFGFSVTACRLMYSYLLDRKQYIYCNGNVSGICPVKSGVPQGSVLGPLLFIMYVNDVFERLISNNCLTFAFADDLQIVFKGNFDFLDVLQNTIDFTVRLLVEWMNENGLSINSNKTKAMLFGGLKGDDVSISICDHDIEVVDSLDCLGIIIDSRLSFESHVSAIACRVNYILRKLYNFNLCLPQSVKKQVVHALIMPIFLYGMEVYSGTLGYVLKKLRLVFNRVMRYVYSVGVRLHITCYVKDFLGCSFAGYIQIRSILHFYKVFVKKTPLFLVELFEFGRSTRNVQIIIPRISPQLERSFLVRVARFYNKLPSTLKSFDYSLDAFKRRLYHHMEINDL